MSTIVQSGDHIVSMYQPVFGFSHTANARFYETLGNIFTSSLITGLYKFKNTFDLIKE